MTLSLNPEIGTVNGYIKWLERITEAAPSKELKEIFNSRYIRSIQAYDEETAGKRADSPVLQKLHELIEKTQAVTKNLDTLYPSKSSIAAKKLKKMVLSTAAITTTAITTTAKTASKAAAITGKTIKMVPEITAKTAKFAKKLQTPIHVAAVGYFFYTLAKTLKPAADIAFTNATAVPGVGFEMANVTAVIERGSAAYAAMLKIAAAWPGIVAVAALTGIGAGACLFNKKYCS